MDLFLSQPLCERKQGLFLVAIIFPPILLQDMPGEAKYFNHLHTKMWTYDYFKMTDFESI